jgi:Na+/H+ antiporter NhaC|tara:strand:+ start:348 stop:527 length:180 start_codon:yes stop_codon:yes gene_type:complete
MQFIKKTSSTTTLIRFAIKSAFVLVLLIVAVFLLNKIDFPTPKKEIEKIISNENFKIVK